MITVTRLNDAQFAVNPDLIERIHESPDTTIVMLEGSKYIVQESQDEIIGLVRDYRASVLARALEFQAASPSKSGK